MATNLTWYWNNLQSHYSIFVVVYYLSCLEYLIEKNNIVSVRL